MLQIISYQDGAFNVLFFGKITNHFFLFRVNWEEAVALNTSVNDENFDQIRNFYKYFFDWFDNWSARELYVLTYAVLIAFTTSIFVYRSFAFFKLFLRASTNLHDKLFRGVTRANMIFFNSNPSGRILNRFSRDINNIDRMLPQVSIDCMDVSFTRPTS